MKTMTCIKAQDRHLKAQVAAGDETHREGSRPATRRTARPSDARSSGWPLFTIHAA